MTRYWIGSSDSFYQVVDAQNKVDAMLADDGAKAFMSQAEMNDRLPKIWQHQGSVAVIDIPGPVINGQAGWMRLFGVVGYEDIKQAAIDAAMSPDTQSILFHINSPGGDVAGVIDCAAVLSQISNMKPSAVHTSDLCASAGYWLATSIKGDITAGQTAIVGSIGVLQVHMERSQMLKDNGVTATVLRSGAYKAEVNSYEQLSPEAKARAEAQLADVHAIFRAQVAKGRPKLSVEDLADVTQGQTFIGKRAKAAGLVDSIASYDQALKLLDKGQHSRNTSSNSKGKAMKIVLNDEQIAAISAGATLDSLGFTAEQIAAHEAAETAEKLAADNDAAAKEAEKIAAEAEAAKLKAAEESKQAQAPPASADVVALLQSQLVTANAQLLAANVELVNLKATTQSQTASHDGLLAIARTAIGKMAIALGGSDSAASTMDAATAITEYTRLSVDFLAKFKPGQQSKAVVEKKDVPKAEVPLGFLAAVKSAKKAA